MKKAIIMILMALPFVLVVIISVAGIILSEYAHISVADVAFVNDSNAIITKYSIGKETVKKLRVQVYPRLATNQNVKFSSSNEEICAVSEDGSVTGIDYGTAIITVSTVENKKTAALEVRVGSDVPASVTLSQTSAAIGLNQTFELIETVLPVTAINKAVEWSTDRPNVAEVDQNGRVKGISPGAAVITVKTMENGLTATCRVEVVNMKAPLRWKESPSGMDVYTVANRTIDLFSLIEYDSALIQKTDIVFRLVSGSANGNLSGNTLVFGEKNKTIKIEASAKAFKADIMLRWSQIN